MYVWPLLLLQFCNLKKSEKPSILCKDKLAVTLQMVTFVLRGV